MTCVSPKSKSRSVWTADDVVGVHVRHGDKKVQTSNTCTTQRFAHKHSLGFTSILPIVLSCPPRLHLNSFLLFSL